MSVETCRSKNAEGEINDEAQLYSHDGVSAVMFVTPVLAADRGSDAAPSSKERFQPLQ
jgi:hypothetical protein